MRCWVCPRHRRQQPRTHSRRLRPADFGFDDAQRDKYLGGYVAAAFYMVGAPAALLFGYLSDTSNRRNLLFAAVLLGEQQCTGCRGGCGSQDLGTGSRETQPPGTPCATAAAAA